MSALEDRLSYICRGNHVPLVPSTIPLVCVGSEKFLFRFELLNTRQEFSRCLEYWYTSVSPHIQVDDRLLLVDKSCDQLYTSSFDDTTCLPQEVSCSPSVAGGLIGGILIGAVLAVVIITITLLTCFRKKITQRNTKKTGIGSCTVLDTVGTVETVRQTYKPKKSKLAVRQKPSSHDSEDNYEMLPYQGEEQSGSQYVDNPTTKKTKTQPTFDPDYEIPQVFMEDQQKAAAAATAARRAPSPQYEPFVLDSPTETDARPITNKMPPLPGQNKVSSILPASVPPLSTHGVTKPAVAESASSKQEKPVTNKMAANTFGKMPLLPTKKTPSTSAGQPETPKKKT